MDGRTIPVIGRAALLKNKRAAGRPQDMAAMEAIAPTAKHDKLWGKRTDPDLATV